jgi:hypothetical protein
MNIFRKTVMTLASLALCAMSAHASATTVYVAQNAAGAANGADCADAKPVSFFNSSGNWGSGSAQIGPGTTVHLCGTFTGAAGSTMLTIQGAGASGNPVTVLFEGGAQLNAPYWSPNGAIYCAGFNYITVDGGASSVIQNTADGTTLAYQMNSTGVDFEGCDHSEIRNLNVQNIYVHSGTGSDGTGAGILEHSIAIASIHNNTVMWAGNAIDVNWINGASNIAIYSNTTDYHIWGIAIGDESGGSSSASGVNVYNNSIGPHFDVFLDTAQTHHGDGIIVNSPGPTGVLSNSNFYNNYVHGDLSCNSALNTTAYIFAAGYETNVNFFNNVLVHECGTNGPEGLMRLASSTEESNIGIYNNTMVIANHITSAIKYNGGSFFASKNNIFSGAGVAYFATSPGSNFTADYNDYYNVSAIADSEGGTHYSTLAVWTQSSQDPHGTTVNPNLSATYVPQSGSPVATVGANLTNLGMALLDVDKVGAPRPGSGAWVAGAYQMGGGVLPAPPTSVSATVE